MTCCDMKGFLSFLVLRFISRKEMSGEDIRKELERRKGTKPSPGTIYPVLKHLHEQGFIEPIDAKAKEKKYRVTAAGRKEAKDSTKRFISLFCCMREDFSRT